MKELWSTGEPMPLGRYVYVRNAEGGRCGELALGYHTLRDGSSSPRAFPRCPENHLHHTAQWAPLNGPARPEWLRDGFPVSR